MANALQSWRWALRVTPFLGLCAVVLLLFCNEPKRGQSEGSNIDTPTSYSEDLKHLFNNRSFILSTVGFTCVAFVAGALAWWSPSYMYIGLKTQNKTDEISLTE